MKKTLIATLIAGLSFGTVALAEEGKNFAHIQYTFRDTVSDNKADPNRQGVNFTIGRKVLDNLTIDLGEQFRTERLNNDNGVSTTRLETGATYTYGLVKGIELYTRGGLGYKVTSTDDYSYYSVEPGVKYTLTNALAVKAGYRFRDAFSDSYNEKTNTVRVGAEYAIAKDQALTLGIDRSYGASDFIGYNAGYAIKF
jgi:opacity protein-like surface antigen